MRCGSRSGPSPIQATSSRSRAPQTMEPVFHRSATNKLAPLSRIGEGAHGPSPLLRLRHSSRFLVGKTSNGTSRSSPRRDADLDRSPLRPAASTPLRRPRSQLALSNLRFFQLVDDHAGEFRPLGIRHPSARNTSLPSPTHGLHNRLLPAEPRSPKRRAQPGGVTRSRRCASC